MGSNNNPPPPSSACLVQVVQQLRGAVKKVFGEEILESKDIPSCKTVLLFGKISIKTTNISSGMYKKYLFGQ